MKISEKLVGTKINPKDKREVFIHATIECIVEHGYAETTVRKIAKYAGVTPGLLIHYFDGKEDLIAQTYQYLSTYLMESYGEKTRRLDNDPVEFLRAFFAARIESETLNPKLLRVWLTFWSMTLIQPDMKHIHTEIYENSLSSMEEMLINAYRANGTQVDEKKLRRTAIGILALLDGLWLEWSLDPSCFSADEALLIVTEFVQGTTGLDLSKS